MKFVFLDFVLEFVYPWMLVFVAVLPVAGVAWALLRARTGKRLAAFVAPALRGRLLPRGSRLFGLQAVLLLLGLALVFIAAARPRWGKSEEKVQIRSRNVVVALDVSRSMLAEDIHPNRLECAKSDIAELIDSLAGTNAVNRDRCALLAFRNTCEVLCPLTTDYNFLRRAVEGAGIHSAGRGETDIGKAIDRSLDLLKDAKNEHGAIVLISDGGDLRRNYLAAAKKAKRLSIPIFTVGIGDEVNESTIPDASGSGVQKYRQDVVKTRLEDDKLREIARESGGRYVPLATTGMAETTLGAIFRKYLSQLVEADLAEEGVELAGERFGWFLVPGMVLLLMAALFSRGRFAGRVVRKVQCAALLAVLCGGVCAAETNAPSETADGEPKKADGESAENRQGASLGNRDVWNMGLDCYRQGDYTNALLTLRKLMRTRSHGARASEIVGAIRHADATNALAEAEAAQRDLGDAAAIEPMQRALFAREESIRAMQRALRESPDDPRVNRNFTRVTADLEKLRDDLHVKKVWTATENRDVKSLVTQSAREALALLKDQADVLTNEAHVAVTRSEDLAKRAEALADAFIPLKRKLPQAYTNEAESAEILDGLRSAHECMKRAADELADLSPDAGESLSRVETEFYDCWKRLLEPKEVFGEAVRAQSNVVTHAEQENGRSWQKEALDFTQRYSVHFREAWARQHARDASVSSNALPHATRVGNEIDESLRKIGEQQKALVAKPDDAGAKSALDGLVRVRERIALFDKIQRADQLELLEADISMQSNACARAAYADGFNRQQDALDYTCVFRERFPAWAKQQYAQDRPDSSSSNAPPYTAHVAGTIDTAMQEIEKKQRSLLNGPDDESANLALLGLRRVYERSALLTADPLQLLDADISIQSNVCAHVERTDGYSWQQDAIDHTRVFHARFPAWASQRCGNDAQTSSNEPPYTVRMAQEILGEALKVAESQRNLLKTPNDETSIRAYFDLRHMRDRCELLALDPRQLVDVDLLLQTNAYVKVKREDGFSWQQDALDSTRIFSERFPAWAQQYEQQAQVNTNMPPFTKERQAEVAALAADVERIQSGCVKDPVPSGQLDAMRKIERIRELLPPEPIPQNNNKDKNKDKSKDQDQNKNQDKDQDQDKDKDQDQDKDKDQDQDQDKDKDQDQDQDQDKDKDQEPEQDQQKVPAVRLSEEEIEDLIRKVRERSMDFYKRQMNKEEPPRPNLRDW